MVNQSYVSLIIFHISYYHLEMILVRGEFRWQRGVCWMENPFSGTCPACPVPLNGIWGPPPVQYPSLRVSWICHNLTQDLSFCHRAFVFAAAADKTTHSVHTEHQKKSAKILFFWYFIFLYNDWKFTLKVVLAKTSLKCELFFVDKLEVRLFEIWGEVMLTMRPLESRSLISLPSSCQEEDGA